MYQTPLCLPPPMSPCHCPASISDPSKISHMVLLLCSGLASVVVQSLSHVTIWDPMDCSMPGFTVLHHFPELAQTRVHWIRNSIQPSHPLSSPSPPALNLSQHQSLFQWVGSSYQWLNIGASVSASVFLMNMQDWFPLGLTGLISLQSKGLSTPQSKSFKSLWLRFLYGPTLTPIHDYWKNHIFDYMDLCQQDNVSAF